MTRRPPSSRQRSTLPNRPTPPGLETNSPSLQQTQGGSERASVAIATNAPFSEWSKTFTDKRLAAAVVDRITYRAHIIQTGTTSYRLTSR